MVIQKAKGWIDLGKEFVTDNKRYFWADAFGIGLGYSVLFGLQLTIDGMDSDSASSALSSGYIKGISTGLGTTVFYTLSHTDDYKNKYRIFKDDFKKLIRSNATSNAGAILLGMGAQWGLMEGFDLNSFSASMIAYPSTGIFTGVVKLWWSDKNGLTIKPSSLEDKLSKDS